MPAVDGTISSFLDAIQEPDGSVSPGISQITTTNTVTTVPGQTHAQHNLKDLAVPENFSMVVPGIYRSSFPRAENFEYLKSKHFKSILVLVPDPYPEENMKFMKENNIQFFQVGMSGNKEPFVNVSDDTITKALKIAINPANHPLLIHCNRGKHRTGCLVGCIRKLQDWSLTMIFDEYRRFAHPKVRPLDQQFIELYDEREVVLLGRVYKWLPIKWYSANPKSGSHAAFRTCNGSVIGNANANANANGNRRISSMASLDSVNL
ncbi:tyrosine phosphatase family-domain-containing protein [Lipomyces oligophaga]|uniref:tyrosine phosphatase family-domain-containing protein n=1 Tax=Lipomyces oligophaga TaxID=45792 RepID=UPI0034CF6A61